MRIDMSQLASQKDGLSTLPASPQNKQLFATEHPHQPASTRINPLPGPNVLLAAVHREAHRLAGGELHRPAWAQLGFASSW